MDYDHQFKLRLIGNSGVGKSCLLLRFADNNYTDSYISTIGVDFKIKQFELDGKTFKLQIWDVAGQERFRTIDSGYIKGSHGVVAVFDLTDRSSFISLPHQITECLDRDCPGASVIIVGAKCDLKDKRVVCQEEGQVLADQYNARYIEVSSKYPCNVEEAFQELTRAIYKKDTLNNMKEKQEQIILYSPSTYSTFSKALLIELGIQSKGLGKTLRNLFITRVKNENFFGLDVVIEALQKDNRLDSDKKAVHLLSYFKYKAGTFSEDKLEQVINKYYWQSHNTRASALIWRSYGNVNEQRNILSFRNTLYNAFNDRLKENDPNKKGRDEIALIHKRVVASIDYFSKNDLPENGEAPRPRELLYAFFKAEKENLNPLKLRHPSLSNDIDALLEKFDWWILQNQWDQFLISDKCNNYYQTFLVQRNKQVVSKLVWAVMALAQVKTKQGRSLTPEVIIKIVIGYALSPELLSLFKKYKCYPSVDLKGPLIAPEQYGKVQFYGLGFPYKRFIFEKEGGTQLKNLCFSEDFKQWFKNPYKIEHGQKVYAQTWKRGNYTVYKAKDSNKLSFNQGFDGKSVLPGICIESINGSFVAYNNVAADDQYENGQDNNVKKEMFKIRFLNEHLCALVENLETDFGNNCPPVLEEFYKTI